MTTPEFKENALYHLLREGYIAEFNQRRAAGEPCDLRGADLRHLDLRGMDTRGLDLGDTYLRQADLRGLDLLAVNLDGASINGAKISGTHFPRELSAEEITLSLLHGTRMRYR
jgi:Pentapeptide repeats (8 copies)